MFKPNIRPFLAPDDGAPPSKLEMVARTVAMMNQNPDRPASDAETDNKEIPAVNEADESQNTAAELTQDEIDLLDNAVKNQEPEKMWAKKFKTPEAMEKSYLSAQTEMLKATSAKDVAIKAQEELKAQVAALKEQLEAKATQPVSTETTEDMPNYYDDPEGFIERKIAEGIKKGVEEKIKALDEKYQGTTEFTNQLQEERRKDRMVKEFATNHPDYVDYQAEMQEAFNQYPYISKSDNPLELAYAIAKKPKTEVDEAAIVRKYLNNIKAKNSNAPPIGAKATDKSPAPLVGKPKTEEEMKKAAVKLLDKLPFFNKNN